MRERPLVKLIVPSINLSVLTVLSVRMFRRSFRASKTFTTLVVCVAIFTDILLQNLVVPVLPYALQSRIGLEDEAEIQKWTSLLLSAFGCALMVGSCTSC